MNDRQVVTPACPTAPAAYWVAWADVLHCPHRTPTLPLPHVQCEPCPLSTPLLVCGRRPTSGHCLWPKAGASPPPRMSSRAGPHRARKMTQTSSSAVQRCARKRGGRMRGAWLTARATLTRRSPRTSCR